MLVIRSSDCEPLLDKRLLKLELPELEPPSKLSSTEDDDELLLLLSSLWYESNALSVLSSIGGAGGLLASISAMVT